MAKQQQGASAASLLNLLGHRLIELRRCVSRIDGIKNRLGEIKISVPVMPTPEEMAVSHAISAVYETKHRLSPKKLAKRVVKRRDLGVSR